MNDVKIRASAFPDSMRWMSVAVTGLIGAAGLYIAAGITGVVLALLVLVARWTIPASLMMKIMKVFRQLIDLEPTHTTHILLRRLCERAGVNEPFVVVSEGAGIDARAVQTAGRGIVVLHRGLLARPEAEKEAVLAHELAHLQERHALPALLALFAAVNTAIVVTLLLSQLEVRSLISKLQYGYKTTSEEQAGRDRWSLARS